MSAKTPIFLLLGMCLSFSVVLAVIIAVRPQAPTPKRRPPLAVQARTAAPPETPLRPQAPPSAVKTDPKPLSPSAALRPMDMTPAAEAARELDQGKRELRALIAALKKDRDQMLNNLAAQLATLPLADAAVQLRELDDESAGLVLARLKPEKRRALLGQLEPARANRLAQALTPPPH